MRNYQLLPKGAKVKMSKGSEYCGLQGIDDLENQIAGIIDSVSLPYEHDSDLTLRTHYFYYSVQWDDGKKNSYRPIDIELFESGTEYEIY